MAGDKVWLLLAAALCAAAHAGEPPPAPAQPPPTAAGDSPDAEFIEFLGSDDHGDKWWEIVKKVPPPASKDAGAGTAPPQQAKP